MSGVSSRGPLAVHNPEDVVSRETRSRIMADEAALLALAFADAALTPRDEDPRPDFQHLAFEGKPSPRNLFAGIQIHRPPARHPEAGDPEPVDEGPSS